MKDWSIAKPLDNWRIKLYFDTNVLIFLSDKTHIGLNHSVNYLNSISPFVDLISSEYALFEFLENRKKKHYKKHLKDNRISESNRVIDSINFITRFVGFRIVKSDSKFKWNNYYSYNISGFSYLNIYQEINQKVEDEIKSLREEIGVVYHENIFNSNLFEPTKQLCLSSRVSRQDCMITTSASFPNDTLKMKDIVIWTCDHDYYKAFHECTEVENIFKENKPLIEWTNDLKFVLKSGKVRSLNLESNPQEETVKDVIKNKIIQYIRSKNSNLFIGITDKAPNAVDVIYISTEVNLQFPSDGIYLTIIGKNLDFIISSKLVEAFWNDGQAVAEADFPNINIGSVISAKWNYTDSHENLRADIIASLKEPGHLVFFSAEN
jgi:hypothetical protein